MIRRSRTLPSVPAVGYLDHPPPPWWFRRKRKWSRPDPASNTVTTTITITIGNPVPPSITTTVTITSTPKLDAIFVSFTHTLRVTQAYRSGVTGELVQGRYRR